MMDNLTDDSGFITLEMVEELRAEIERLQTLLLATSQASFTNDTTSTASFTNDTSDEGDHT